MDPVQVLSRTALFQGIPLEELEPLAPAVKVRNYSAGSYIFHEGDPANVLYVVVRGQVKIARLGSAGNEAVFAVLLPGDSFGELTLFDEDPIRSMDAEAMEPTECLTVERQALLAFVERNPAVVRRIIQVLRGYVRQVDESFSEAAFLDIPGRVARKLLDLAAEHGQKTSEGVRIEMRLTQRTLAGMVAASRENVNRALSRLAGRGDIIQQAGYITIVRPAELRKRS
jgi:CRP/FNR family transcriptional regulator/CRP/FNR family cyclic AMP-dependent transcriptional regulator